MSFSSLIALAITVAIPLLAVYFIFALDLYGTGKESTILTCIGWGAIGAFWLSLQINNRLLLPNIGYEQTVGLFGPIIEEILKSLVLIFFIQRPRFRYAVDGAIYGFAVGIGFSVTENMYYLADPRNASLGFAIARVLSASLMHATVSGLVGISFGRLRRSGSSGKVLWSVGGILLAMALHIAYNLVVSQTGLNPTVLLLLAIGMGIGGSVVIAFLIQNSLKEEQQKFKQSLGMAIGVTDRERAAVQQVGSDAYEQAMSDLGAQFGTEKEGMIRRLSSLQANVGILRNNLAGNVSGRLRTAWEAEIAAARDEMERLRRGIGVYAMSFYRNVFPDDTIDDEAAQLFRTQVAIADPEHVHSFDLFAVNVALSADEQQQIADTLGKVDIFKDVPAHELENLSRAVQRRTYRDSDVLFRQGDAGDKLYLIEDGAISIYSAQRSGEETLINTTGAGEAVGELALVDDAPRSATAKAKGALTVYELKRDQFKSFMQSRPQVIMAVLTYLAQRVRFSTEIVESSIAWANSIARGDLIEAQRLSRSTVASVAAGTGSGRMSLRGIGPIDDELESIIPDSPMAGRMSIFRRASTALAEREQNTSSSMPVNRTDPAARNSAGIGNTGLSRLFSIDRKRATGEQPAVPAVTDRKRATGEQPSITPVVEPSTPEQTATPDQGASSLPPEQS